MSEPRIAVIVGAGAGLSASVARAASADGMMPILAARNPEKLNVLEAITGGVAKACDASNPEDVAALFDWVTSTHGVPELVVYNPSARVRGPVADLDPEAVQKAIMITAFGGFLVGQAVGNFDVGCFVGTRVGHGVGYLETRRDIKEQKEQA